MGPSVLSCITACISIFPFAVPTGRWFPHNRSVQPFAHCGGSGRVRAARRARLSTAAIRAPHVIPQRGAIEPHGHFSAGEPAEFHAIATAQVDWLLMFRSCFARIGTIWGFLDYTAIFVNGLTHLSNHSAAVNWSEGKYFQLSWTT